MPAPEREPAPLRGRSRISNRALVLYALLTSDMRETMVKPAAGTSARAKSGRIQIFDYLRLTAAIAVMAFHYLFNGIANGKMDSLSHSPQLISVAKYGYLGVDLFFLISGFVIVGSARGKTARQFVVGRAVRLYPAFWAAVVFTATFSVFFGGHRMAVTGPQVLANLTMVPQLINQPFVDGVYWTLLYELEFYALVFVLLMFGQGRRLEILIPFYVLGMALASWTIPSAAIEIPYLGGYFVLFASGAVIATIRQHGWTLLRAVALAAGLVTATRFEISNAAGMSAQKDTYYSPVILGVLTVLFFAALLSTCLPSVSSLKLRGSLVAGALTYPVYLIHAHFGYMLLSVFATDANKCVIYPTVVIVVLAIAYAMHVLMEKHPVAFWFRFFDWTVGTMTGAVLCLTGKVKHAIRVEKT